MKKVWFYGISSVVIVFLSCFIIKDYQEYGYLKKIKKAKESYNQEMQQCDIVGTTTNYLFIKRTRKDYTLVKKGKWQLTNLKNKKTYTFSIHKNGVGGLVGLPSGEYSLKEIETEKKEQKDKITYKIIFDKTNKVFHLKTRGIQNVSRIIIRLRNKEKQPILGVRYDVYDIDGTYVHSMRTKENGITALENMPAGSYYLERYGIENAKKHFFTLGQDEDKTMELVEEEELESIRK